jgi:hypothetical protein
MITSTKGNGANKMASLKIKTKINCNTCGCTLNRTKTIKVTATTQEEAKAEAGQKVKKWEESLKGQNCKVCKSIIEDLAA